MSINYSYQSIGNACTGTAHQFGDGDRSASIEGDLSHFNRCQAAHPGGAILNKRKNSSSGFESIETSSLGLGQRIRT